MRSCKEIVRLIASGEPLSLGQRVELRIHMMMCKHCSKYRKHLRIMRDSFMQLFRDLTSPADGNQVELKKEIKRKIRETPRPDSD